MSNSLESEEKRIEAGQRLTKMLFDTLEAKNETAFMNVVKLINTNREALPYINFEQENGEGHTLLDFAISQGTKKQIDFLIDKSVITSNNVANIIEKHDVEYFQKIERKIDIDYSKVCASIFYSVYSKAISKNDHSQIQYFFDKSFPISPNIIYNVFQKDELELFLLFAPHIDDELLYRRVFWNAKEQKNNIIKHLIENKKIDIEQKSDDRQETLILSAIEGQNRELYDLLRSHDANPTERNKYGCNYKWYNVGSLSHEFRKTIEKDYDAWQRKEGLSFFQRRKGKNLKLKT